MISPLKLFADQCVPGSVIQTLRNAGCEVFVLKDHIPTDSADPVVISKAQGLDSILISLDGDFADIVNYPPKQYKGIIALQIRNHPEIIPQLMLRLTDYLSNNQDMDHYIGKLFLVEAHRIRVRE
jgi:predicted nuclease of predicted toxin-antitoxin system